MIQTTQQQKQIFRGKHKPTNLERERETERERDRERQRQRERNKRGRYLEKIAGNNSNKPTSYIHLDFLQ